MYELIKDKFADFQFWWAKKTLKKNVDYKIHETAPMVEILKGEFEGVMIWFDDVTLREDGLVDFSTVILENPRYLDVCTKKFVKLSTNLFRITLSEFVAKPNNNTDKVINESRTIDTDEPDQEREFHEENSPLLEARILKRQSRKKIVPTDSGIHPEIQQPAKSERTGNRTTGKERSKRK
jgi:hypothetical protein